MTKTGYFTIDRDGKEMLVRVGKPLDVAPGADKCRVTHEGVEYQLFIDWRGGPLVAKEVPK